MVKTWSSRFNGKSKKKLKNCKDEQKEFYECTILVLEGAVHFMQRYHDLIESEKIESLKDRKSVV